MRGGYFYMATSGYLVLATHGYFFMATDRVESLRLHARWSGGPTLPAVRRRSDHHAAAAESGLTLLTRDRRALLVYRALEVNVEMIGG